MIELIRKKDTNEIMDFLKGEGIRKRCAGGVAISKEDCSMLVAGMGGCFLMAYEDSKLLGFVVFYPESASSYSIHVCLKTIGKKTRQVVKMAIEWSKENLNPNSILAYFRPDYRGAAKLAEDLNFVDLSEKNGFRIMELKIN